MEMNFKTKSRFRRHMNDSLKFQESLQLSIDNFIRFYFEE